MTDTRLDSIEIVMAFVRHINARSLDALVSRMTTDHIFIDSQGNRVQGREAMRKGWEAYFAMMPEYEVYIEEIVRGDETVALFGVARGMYSPDGVRTADRRWSVPASWRATVVDEKVAEWQVYADLTPVYKMMARLAAPSAIDGR